MEAPAPPPKRGFPYRLAAAAFILFWTALNLVYIACLCPHDLAPDEAHYWHWSRNLDWSYYSKGPLAAWLIRGSCELFGDTEFAVRLPAALSSAILLAGLYALIADALADRRIALAAILCTATLPAASAGAVVMTIDPPFLACWCWALVGVQRALGSRNALRWWLFGGCCSALGVLAKYPMILLPAAVVGWVLAHRRDEFRRPGIWCFLVLAALGCVPILFWNAVHEWISFRHVLGQASGNAKVNASWLNPVAYLAEQCGLLMGFWFLAFAAGAWRFRRSTDIGMSLAWFASAPVWLLFLLASSKSPGQANWPAAAYIGGAVLAAAWLRTRSVRTLGFALAACMLAILLSFGLRFPQFVRPALASLLPPPSETHPTPIRKLDPTARLSGWRTLAAELDRLREKLRRETGADPALAGMLWTMPGELSFYCRGQPPAYTFGPALQDRHSQYELWRPNPVSDPEAFRGRDFLYVGEEIPDAPCIFDSVDGPILVVHRDGGVPVATWRVWVCRGFRGFPTRRTSASY